MSLQIVLLTENDRSIVERICARDEYNPYRHYPVPNREKRNRVFAAEVWDQYGRDGFPLWAALWNGAPVGLIGFQPLAWDSEQFDKRMGRLWPVAFLPAGGETLSRVAEGLLAAALGHASGEGVEHLACRVSGDHFAVIHALEKQGFLLMDTLVTYLHQPCRIPVPDFRCRHRVRFYDATDRERVLDIARKAGYRSRFIRDPWLSPEKVRAMHEEWAANCCRKIMADEMLVAESGKGVCGFLGYRKHRLFLEQTGKELWGSGLSAVLPETPGAYVSLLHAAVTRQFSGSETSIQPGLPDIMDFETQLSHRSILRVWQAFGFRPARFAYNYHNGNL